MLGGQLHPRRQGRTPPRERTWCKVRRSDHELGNCVRLYRSRLPLLAAKVDLSLNQGMKFSQLLQRYADWLMDKFMIVTEAGVRFGGNRRGEE